MLLLFFSEIDHLSFLVNKILNQIFYLKYNYIKYPVPPAIEWISWNPSRLSLPSASLSIISINVSYNSKPWEYPLAQTFPAPPPFYAKNMFSGLYRLEKAEFWI